MATGNAFIDLQTILGDAQQLRAAVGSLHEGGSIPEAINAAGGAVTPQAQTWFNSAQVAVVRHTMNIFAPMTTLTGSTNDTIRGIAIEADRILLDILDEAMALTIANFRQRARILDGKVAQLESKIAALRRPMNAGKRRKTRRSHTKKRTTRRKHL